MLRFGYMGRVNETRLKEEIYRVNVDGNKEDGQNVFRSN